MFTPKKRGVGWHVTSPKIYCAMICETKIGAQAACDVLNKENFESIKLGKKAANIHKKAARAAFKADGISQKVNNSRIHFDKW